MKAFLFALVLAATPAPPPYSIEAIRYGTPHGSPGDSIEAIRYANAMPHSAIICECLFELLHLVPKNVLARDHNSRIGIIELPVQFTIGGFKVEKRDSQRLASFAA